MSPYSVSLFLHVIAATALVGGSLTAVPLIRGALRRAGTVSDLSAPLRFAQALGRINPLSAMVLLITGIFLTTATSLWNQGWVQVAVAGWLYNTIYAKRFVERTTHALAQEAAQSTSGPVTAHMRALLSSRVWTRGIDVMIANDCAMLYLMTVRPALVSSLLVVLIANLLAFAVRTALGRAGTVAAQARVEIG